MVKKFSSEQILALEMDENDAGAKTIREYLIKLVQNVWSEGEEFSGKRPFGNSGWEYEIYSTLIKNKIIDGHIEDGYIAKCDDVKGHKIIQKAITAI